MSGNPLNIRKWEIDNFTVGIYCESPWGSSNVNSFRLYIPVLMPLIKGPTTPLITKTSLRSSCYLNSPECKPAVSVSIQTQNFKTAAKLPYRSFSNPIFYQGAKLTLEIQNGDPGSIYVTNKTDESSWPPQP